MQEMDKYGICGVELQWFKDYLSNMQHIIIISHPMRKFTAGYHRVP